MVSHRACNICEAICGLVIKVDQNRVESIKGDADDPLSRGYICPKGVALADVHSDPDRLRSPLKRAPDGTWHAIEWDVAFAEIASRLHAIQDEHGDASTGMYLGNPTVHNLGTLLFSEILKDSLGTPQVFSATSLDQLPHHIAAREMFGHSMLLPVPDVDHTDCMLIIGANPVASNGSLMTAPGIRERLKRIQARRGLVVVMDPRKTETAELADRHHNVVPGTDVWVLCALTRIILERRAAVDHNRALELSDGLDRLQSAVSSVTTVLAAERSGMTVEAIEELADSLISAKRAVVYGRMGASTQAHGGLCQWLINGLNIISGNFDEPGGAMFANPAVPLVRGRPRAQSAKPVASRVRNLPAFEGQFPTATLADEILTLGPGQIRALFSLAGNPALSAPNGRKIETALGELDLFVAIDIYLNETTRHAHYILPPTTGIEVENYDLVFNALSVRNTAKYSCATVPPAEGSLHDWQIIGRLAQRLLRFKPNLQWLKRALKARTIRWLQPRGIVDLGLKLGPYGAWISPQRWKSGLTLKRLIRHPHGIDLGPLEPRLPKCLHHPNGRINLAPKGFVARLREVNDQLAQPPSIDDGRLLLIGRRHLLSNNSWMHNVHRLNRGKDRCTLLMHPEDAQARDLSTGDKVVVNNETGRIVTGVTVTEDVVRGVISLPHGYGHDREQVRLGVAALKPGVSINELTSDTALDALTGNAAFSGTRVSVEKSLEEKDSQQPVA